MFAFLLFLFLLNEYVYGYIFFQYFTYVSENTKMIFTYLWNNKNIKNSTVLVFI